MTNIFRKLVYAVDRIAPLGSTKRRMLQILGIVFLLQGISIVFLTSKFGALVGLVSIAVGVFVLLIAPPSTARTTQLSSETRMKEPLGLRLIDYVIRGIGGVYLLAIAGAAVIAAVVIHDSYFSLNPGIGDIDMLAIMFGVVLVLYPFVYEKYRTEASFALIFISLVASILVIPLSFLSVGGGGSEASGNWYVHNLLAAPLSAFLNLMGISSSSEGEIVTVRFDDGSSHNIGISTACAGLYSTSIFLSAFIAFVLVFERLPKRLTAVVLCFGLLVAYLGNLFRMIVIVVVGYYNGMEALLWAHKNVGWMIFLGWSAVFWYLVMRYADRRAHQLKEASDRGAI